MGHSDRTKLQTNTFLGELGESKELFSIKRLIRSAFSGYSMLLYLLVVVLCHFPCLSCGDLGPKRPFASFRSNVADAFRVGAPVLLGSSLYIKSVNARTRSDIEYFAGVERSLSAQNITIPLEEFDGMLCMNYTVEGQPVRAIVDTGSPFVVLPAECSRDWGCLSRPQLRTIDAYVADPPLDDTTEIFGGQDYDAQWRFAPVALGALQASRVWDDSLPPGQRLSPTLVAVVGEDLLRRPGGNFFGLVKVRIHVRLYDLTVRTKA